MDYPAKHHPSWGPSAAGGGKVRIAYSAPTSIPPALQRRSLAYNDPLLQQHSPLVSSAAETRDGSGVPAPIVAPRHLTRSSRLLPGAAGMTRSGRHSTTTLNTNASERSGIAEVGIFLNIQKEKKNLSNF